MNTLLKDFADTIQKHTESLLWEFGGILDSYITLGRDECRCVETTMDAVLMPYLQYARAHEASQISMFEQIVDEWHNLYCADIIAGKQNLDELCAGIKEWSRHIAEDKSRHTIDGHMFNVFHLWSRYSGIGETLHSRLLHFLLSDDELHGQSNKFMIKFLERAGIDNPAAGKWHITAEEGRVDVMLRRENPRSVVVVENKSNWAGDQPNQLYRYWYQNIHHCPEDFNSGYYSNNNQYRIIYLAPNRNKAYSDQTCSRPGREFFGSDEDFDMAPEFLPLTPDVWAFNDELQRWLDECMELLDTTNHPVREYIRQYKEYCQTL